MPFMLSPISPTCSSPYSPTSILSSPFSSPFLAFLGPRSNPTFPSAKSICFRASYKPISFCLPQPNKPPTPPSPPPAKNSKKHPSESRPKDATLRKERKPKTHLNLPLTAKQLLHLPQHSLVPPDGELEIIDFHLLPAGQVGDLVRFVACFDHEVGGEFVEDAHGFVEGFFDVAEGVEVGADWWWRG